jgi:hypothetical protein
VGAAATLLRTNAACIVALLIVATLQLVSFAGLLQFTVGCDGVEDVRRAESMMLAQLKIATINAEIDAVRYNLSAMGSALVALSSRAPPQRIRAAHSRAPPCAASAHSGLVSPRLGRLSSRAELLSKTGSSILAALKSSHLAEGRALRRDWDAVFVLRLLFSMELLRSGASALAWAADRTDAGPLVAFLAHEGVKVVMTPPHNASRSAAAPAHAAQRGWGGHNARGVATRAQWARMVTNRTENVHFISPDLFESVDFAFALHALDAFASTRLAQRFVINSLGVLRPGGVALFSAELDLAAKALEWGGDARVPAAAYKLPPPLNATRCALWTRADVNGVLDDARRLGFDVSEMCWRSANLSALLNPVHVPRALMGDRGAGGATFVAPPPGEPILATVAFWIRKPEHFAAGARARNFSKIALKLPAAQALVKRWRAT